MFAQREHVYSWLYLFSRKHALDQISIPGAFAHVGIVGYRIEKHANALGLFRREHARLDQ